MRLGPQKQNLEHNDPILKRLDYYTREEVAQKAKQVLAGLKYTHKDLKSVQRFLGDWPATLSLLNLMVLREEIELVDGKYRPYGWQSPKEVRAQIVGGKRA